jgi:hypothetical protein
VVKVSGPELNASMLFACVEFDFVVAHELGQIIDSLKITVTKQSVKMF